MSRWNNLHVQIRRKRQRKGSIGQTTVVRVTGWVLSPECFDDVIAQDLS